MPEPIFFPELQLTFVESRILGCLLEKEETTPAYYPLTVKSLQTASNQSSNRSPITDLDEETLEEALEEMRVKKLIERSSGFGSRVPKYAHTLDQILDLTLPQKAILTVLLLRGTQTAGELKTRTERIYSFSSPDEVEETLQSFFDYTHGALAEEIPAGHGRRVKTYAHLLGGNPTATTDTEPPVNQPSSTNSWRHELEERINKLEQKIAQITLHLNITEESNTISETDVE